MSDYVPNGASAFYVEMWEDKFQPNIRPHGEWVAPEDVPLRIGICGAHGTGKAALGKKIAASIDLPYIHHVPRTVKGLGLSLNHNADIKTQVACWFAQVYEQVDLGEFVTDRTIMDYMAYARVMVDKSEDPVDEFILNAMANLTYALATSQYTIVFYLPPSDGYIKNNGFRSRDKEYQAQIDEYILYYLNCFNVDYFPLQGSDTMRYKMAMEYLEDSKLLNEDE